MRKIFLHVGHGKTGSSFIQSAFALSVDVLMDSNIFYPDFGGSLQSARMGWVSSGNFPIGKMSLIECALQAVKEYPDGKAILISNEMLFGQLVGKPGLDLIADLKKADFEPHILCFIRDPMDHAVSHYQQTVKRSGSIKEFKEYLEKYSLPPQVGDFIKYMQEAGAQTTLLNYSRHRNEVISATESWLGLAPGVLNRPDRRAVNRSITNGELMLQLEFNRHLGRKSAALICDPLCNLLPNVKSEFPTIHRDDLASFLDRMRAQVEPVNRILGNEEGYEVPDIGDAIGRFRDPDDETEFSFSREQIEIIAQQICDRIKKLQG